MPAPSALADVPTISGPLPIISTTGPPPAGPANAGPTPTSATLQPAELEGETGTTPSMASAICNLLAVGGSGPASGCPGVYVGEGLPPVPTKLAEQIQRWDFVDMAELLPEYWGVVPGAKLGAEALNAKATRKKKVTNILTWVQCFAVYTSVMAAKHPEATPELMAYLICILRVSQDFGGMAWVNYDSAFRRQAAATANRQWSRVNPSLYSICFAGSARMSTRCDLCLSLTHPTMDCPLVEDSDPEVGSRLKAIESAVLAMSRPHTGLPNMGNPLGGASPEVCRNFNNKRCTFKWCRFRHVCRGCGGPQPALDCCERVRGPGAPLAGGPIGGQARAARPGGSKAREGARPY